eukprot:TRINITY_DN737_c0_g1_i1.p2 TRINITY_DN737_c0_g1~~TRINITY_DN737_c0_g1_i1.p2  ORF type:complete len:129 (-),score=17.72 TRINITY_DN737_c0_g1_i1:284-670(-)
MLIFFFFQAEDGIRDLVRSRGLGDVYKRQVSTQSTGNSTQCQNQKHQTLAQVQHTTCTPSASSRHLTLMCLTGSSSQPAPSRPARSAPPGESFYWNSGALTSHWPTHCSASGSSQDLTLLGGISTTGA